MKRIHNTYFAYITELKQFKSTRLKVG